MPAQWLEFARRDLDAGESLMRDANYLLACFHCQQAIEKALKAFLLHNGQSPPRIHSLDTLLNQCIAFDAALSAFQVGCRRVDQYYMPSRYPDIGLPALPGQTEAQKALDDARAVLNAIETRISPPAPSPP